MKIGVIGTGYVGLVAGACFADTGNQVLCVDKDASKINRLKNGEIPIYEPGLDTLVARNVEQDRLRFTTSVKEAAEDCEIIFMAVGTPPLPTGEPDLSFLKSAVQEVGKHMTGYRLIVNKSTVPIGAHLLVQEWITNQTKHPVDVVSNPEFLKEGTAIEDFLKPDRVVIGAKSQTAFDKMAKLYAPFVRQGNPILFMDPISAEMTKYACNAFLATRISFMNELSQLCEKVGGDIELVRKGMVTDPRIGKHFLYPGVGYGGSCFPKDVQALVSKSKEKGVELRIVTAAENANASQKKHLFNKIVDHFKTKDLSQCTFAIWGLAFKPNTDDIREAPALVLIDALLKAGAKVKAFDPVAIENTKKVFEEKVVFTKNAYEAVKDADALVLVTEWNEFRQADLQKVKASMKTANLFDGRNIFDPQSVKELGFTYYGIGRS